MDKGLADGCGMDDSSWDLLLGRINSKKCTPFLGAGACAGVLPLGRDIAKKLSEQSNFPMKECRTDLGRVSQYCAILEDKISPKLAVTEMLSQVNPPVGPQDFGDNGRLPLHAVLADLSLPIYITTNYDDFMYQALKSRNRNARQALCLWNEYLRKLTQKEWKLNYDPSPENPVVFHLHGHLQVTQSLVLLEDDYLDFLVTISKNEKLIPYKIQEAIAGKSVLFLGYSLADWDFRVLFRSFVDYLGRFQAKHVSVQMMPGRQGMSQDDLERLREQGMSQDDLERVRKQGLSQDDLERLREQGMSQDNLERLRGQEMSPDDVKNMQEYLKKYFGEQKIEVFWGTCQDFAKELRKRI
jgi:hypothetical protein